MKGPASFAMVVLLAAVAAPQAGLSAGPAEIPLRLAAGLVASVELPTGRTEPPSGAAERQDGAAQRGSVDERLRTLFGRAESLYRSVDPQRAYDPLSQVITALAPTAERNTLSNEGRLLLMRSLAYRADVSLTSGDRNAADADFERLLRLSPAISIEAFRVSADARERLDRVRSRLVGHVEISVSPADARIFVDGVEIGAGPTLAHAVLAGPHVVEVRLPGFTGVREEVEVRGGRREALDYTLHRVSSVLRLMTSPPGARVAIDGRPMAETAGTAPADFVPRGEAAGIPRTEISGELVIENLLPGEHDVEVTLEGYRPVRSSLVLDELADYSLGVVVLERSFGTLLVRDLPADAQVWIDGRRVQPQAPAAVDVAPGERTTSAARLTLEPGRHLLTIDAGTTGVFEAEVSVAEGQTQMLTPRLVPAVTLLGVLGGDRLAASAIDTALRQSLGGLTRWNLLDRSEQGERLLRGAGLSAERLRELVSGEATVDWALVQGATGGALPGSMFVLAVLGSDTMAEFADLWVWAVAPGPAWAERVRVELAGGGDLERLARRLDDPAPFRRSRFGALLIDSDGAASPVVASVYAGGPAERAGLAVGDEILSVGGNRVVTSANTRAWLQTFRPGDNVVLAVRGAGGDERTLEVRMDSTPAVVSPTDPQVLYAAVWAVAASSVGSLDAEVPTWVLQLNQVAALLQARQWRAAADLLADIEAPERAGLGRGMVDYWLGLALSRLGEVGRARQALERALAAGEARYLHDDGPLLASRAWARLASLEGR